VIDSCSELVVCRKGCRICIERDPGKIHNGADFDFDPPVVSHWSQWLGHKRPRCLSSGRILVTLDILGGTSEVTIRRIPPTRIFVNSYITPE